MPRVPNVEMAVEPIKGTVFMFFTQFIYDGKKWLPLYDSPETQNEDNHITPEAKAIIEELK